MLEIKNLTAASNGKNVISDLSLCFEKKGIYAVLCASDVQKTLLAQLICGCRNADAGQIHIGEDVMSRDNVTLKKKVRLAPREDSICADITPYEYIQFTGFAIGVEREKLTRQIEESIALLGLGDVRYKTVRALTPGQRSRLSLAAALIGNPDVIVADSILDHLGGKTLDDMYEVFDMLSGIKTVVLLTSKPSCAKRLCGTAAFMANGRIALLDKIGNIEAKINESAQTKISARGNSDDILAAIRAMDGVIDAKVVKTARDNVCEIEIEHGYDAFIKDRLFTSLATINAPILSSETAALTISDVFYTLCVRADKTDKEMENNNKKGAKK